MIDLNHPEYEYLARISHELRTPLAGLRMWVEVLRSGRPEDRVRAIDAIDQCARAQSRLIEDLLDLARGYNGDLHISDDVVDPRLALRAAVAELREEAEAKGLHVVTALDRGSGLVRGDAGRLQQVGWNLLSNAVKFTAPGGRIEVSLRGGDADVVLTVEDSGIGLDEPALATLFTPFPEGTASVGLALGLAITRQLVVLHGGTIRGENRAGGVGARFTVTLPRYRETRRLPTPVERPGAPAASRDGAAVNDPRPKPQLPAEASRQE